MRKKIMSILIVGMIVIELFCGNIYARQDVHNIEGGELLKQFCNQKIEKSYESTMENYKQIQAGIKSDYILKIVETSDEHRKYFGGTYIDNNDELVIMLTETVEEEEQFYESVVGSDSVCYEQCEVTLVELKKIKENILTFCERNKESEDEDIAELIDSIVSVGTYIDENVVYVEIINFDAKKEDVFKKYVSASNRIVFEDVNKNELDASKLYIGDNIYTYTDGEATEYSIGFRCKRLISDGSYSYGFVTAGHNNFILKGVFIGYTSRKPIGLILVRAFNDGGKVDASYVVTYSDYELCSVTATDEVYITGTKYISNYTTGATVYKANFWGEEKGKIKSTDATFTSEGITIKDVVKATYASYAGDSGTLIYMKQNGKNVPAGIHMGRAKKWYESGVYSYFIKAKNIINELDVIPY